MAKDVISVDGEEKVVREDTAKSYRGVIWALTSIAIFIAILAVLMFTGVLTSLTGGDGKIQTPSEQNTRR